MVRVGIIIRNHLGLVCASAAQKMLANFSPMVAEAVALLLGISFAVNSGLCPASLASDAAVVVAAVNDSSPLFYEFGTVLHDVLESSCMATNNPTSSKANA
ncbi:hypothetical protein ACOSP7_017498 [Xanthoceras sorbifolium]